MKSTRSNLAAIIVFTALQPPPPTPTTRIFAACLLSSIELIAFPLENLLKPLAHPPLHLLVDVVFPNAEHSAILVLGTVDNESDAGCVHRAFHHVDQSTDSARHSPADRQAENFLGQLGHAGEQRRSAGNHHPRRQQLLVAAALDLPLHKLEDLLHPRLQDFAENLAAEHP